MPPIVLACAWHPRGELPRWIRARPLLERAYDSLTFAVPSGAGPEDVRTLREALGARVTVASRGFTARTLSIREALRTASPSATHVHYADGDRLVRWIETRPEEWRRTLDEVSRTDFLIIGRTERAFATHPRALQDPERLINAVAAHVLGATVDLGAGSRGLSRAAAEAVLSQTADDHWGDFEWPVVLQRLGFRIERLAVDGLDWESADRGRDRAADADAQRQLAEVYDQRAENWASRVRAATEIIQEALNAALRPL